MIAGAVAAALLVVGGVAAWWLRRTFLVTTVTGRSMQPTYRDGDRLLVRRTRVAAIGPGDVVVLVRGEMTADSSSVDDGVSRRSRPLIIKRAAAVPGDPVPDGIPVPDRIVPPDRLVILGDNPDASVDSRLAGYYLTSDVVGVVVRFMG